MKSTNHINFIGKTLIEALRLTNIYTIEYENTHISEIDDLDAFYSIRNNQYKIFN